MRIQLFEAFASKSVSAIEKFLGNLDKEGRQRFVNILKEISRNRDIPLSNFKGEYLKSSIAMKINSDNDEIIKFWFSVTDGFLGITTTKKYSAETDLSWMNSAYIQNFITNNVFSNSNLSQLRWDKERYDKIISSQFALVINITELQKGLTKLQSLRKDNKKGAISLLSNDAIAAANRGRRKDILDDKRGLKDEHIADMIYNILRKYRCHDEYDLVDVCYELFYRGKFSTLEFKSIIDHIYRNFRFSNSRDPRSRDRGYDSYGGDDYDNRDDRDGFFGGGFGGGRFRRW